MTEEYGHIFIWIYEGKDNPESKWEPFEVIGPIFNRISNEGYNYKRKKEK